MKAGGVLILAEIWFVAFLGAIWEILDGVFMTIDWQCQLNKVALLSNDFLLLILFRLDLLTQLEHQLSRDGWICVADCLLVLTKLGFTAFNFKDF